jgi:hypothetical protein
LLAACRDEVQAGALRLIEFRQLDFDSVALNEELLFYFSSELERSSVTHGSVRILDEDGNSVPGELSVRGNALSFHPVLPREPHLNDGGFRPGRRYQAQLGGFPRPDGLRSKSGAVLSASLLLGFQTVEVGKGPLFLDPGRGPFRLLPRGRPAGPMLFELEGGQIVLEHGEALDPTSVPASRFELVRYGPGVREAGAPIPVAPRLVVNRRDHAELLVEPLQSSSSALAPLAPGTYFLTLVGRDLRTLGGRQVEPGWNYLQLNPVPRLDLDPSSLAEDPVLGCSGAAQAVPLQGLRLRFPAAAGMGSAGEVELERPPEVFDVHATRLVVPPDRGVDLSAIVGPVVLRSQTRLEVQGRLIRRGRGSPDQPMIGELERAARLPASRHAALSSWLERLLDRLQPWANEPWTVLVAGGDIEIAAGAAIEVEGPLILVAGGRIRVHGSATGGELWKSLPASGNLAGHRRQEVLPLILDEPALNPLATELRIGALTSPFRWNARKGRWQLRLVGTSGSGTMDVDFLQALPGQTTERVVRDPNELATGMVRARVTFEVEPAKGGAFHAPHLERLLFELAPSARP